MIPVRLGRFGGVMRRLTIVLASIALLPASVHVQQAASAVCPHAPGTTIVTPSGDGSKCFGLNVSRVAARPRRALSAMIAS